MISSPREPKAPLWPSSDPETESAIGRLVLAWGVLEREIDEAIVSVYRLNDTLGGAIAANLGTKAKLEICQAAVHILAEELAFSGDLVTIIDSLVTRTAALSADRRLVIAHGQPWQVTTADGPVWVLMKHSARKGGLTARGYHLTPEPFIEAVELVRTLVDDWFAFRQAVAKSDRFRRFLEQG